MMSGKWGRRHICGEAGLLESTLMPHRCKPQFEWRSDDLHGEDEWRSIRATNEEAAAIAAAEDYDEVGEYCLLRGEAAVISVRNPRTGTVTRWTISGESVPRYSAEKIEEGG